MQMPRLVLVFAGRAGAFVGFVVLCLNHFSDKNFYKDFKNVEANLPHPLLKKCFLFMLDSYWQKREIPEKKHDHPQAEHGFSHVTRARLAPTAVR